MYITYKKSDYILLTLGELLDEMDELMFIPDLNTIMLIVLELCVCIFLIIKYTGILKLWDKIRNIKL